MQHLLHFLIVQEQVRAWLLGNHETVAVAVGADTAGHEAGFIRQGIGTVATGADLAVAFHCVQAAAQDFLGGGLHFERARQGGCGERRAGVAENTENFFAAGNGMSRLLQIVFLNFFYICAGPAGTVVGLTP